MSGPADWGAVPAGEPPRKQPDQGPAAWGAIPAASAPRAENKPLSWGAKLTAGLQNFTPGEALMAEPEVGPAIKEAAKRYPQAVVDIGAQRIREAAQAQVKRMEQAREFGETPAYERGGEAFEGLSRIVSTPKAALGRAIVGHEAPGLETAAEMIALAPAGIQAAGKLGAFVKAAREARAATRAAQEAKVVGMAQKAADLGAKVEIGGKRVQPTAAAPPAGPPPAVSMSAADAVKAAIQTIQDRTGRGFPHIAEVIKESGLPREAVHSELQRMAQAGDVSLHRSSIADARYSEAERKDWLHIPDTNETFALVGMRRASEPSGTVPPAGLPPSPPGTPPHVPPPKGAPPLGPDAPKPPKEFVHELEWQTQMLKGGKTAAAIEQRKYIREFDQLFPEFKTPAAKATLFNKEEAGAPLTPREQEAMAHLQPARDRTEQLFRENSERLGREDVKGDPHYLQALAIGHWPAFEEGTAHSPFGDYGRSIRRRVPSIQAPKYVALVDPETGARTVVQDLGENMFQSWHGGAAGEEAKFIGDLHQGGRVLIDGKDYEVARATTLEKETNTGTKYHRDPVVAVTNALNEQEELKRNLDFFDFLKQGGSKFMTNTPSRAPSDWRKTKIPSPYFENLYFHPKIANVLDAYWRPGMGSEQGLDMMRRINHLALNTMFFGMPVPHIVNTAFHAFVAAGHDLLPHAWYGLARTGVEAIKEVVSSGPKYLQLLKEGNGLVYAGMLQQDAARALTKRMAMEIEQRPQNWQGIAKTLGMSAVDLARAVGRASQKVLWGANDIFMMQRVLMLQRGTALRRGMPLREAIEHAEKHVPSYKIPAEVFGSRGLSQLMQDNLLTMFNRYHYGAMASYAHMAKALIAGSGRDKFEAAGHLMALGFLALVVQPALDKAAQKLSGDPNASFLPRGPMPYVEAAKAGVKAAMGTGSSDEFWKQLGNALILSPAIQLIVDTSRRMDWRGRHLVQADDPLDTQIAKMGMHALGLAVPPVETIASGIRKGGVGGEFIRREFGVHQPSDAEKKYKEKEAKKRDKMKPHIWERGGFSRVLTGH